MLSTKLRNTLWLQHKLEPQCQRQCTYNIHINILMVASIPYGICAHSSRLWKNNSTEFISCQERMKPIECAVLIQCTSVWRALLIQCTSVWRACLMFHSIMSCQVEFKASSKHFVSKTHSAIVEKVRFSFVKLGSVYCSLKGDYPSYLALTNPNYSLKCRRKL